jgi:hypothetical protein
MHASTGFAIAVLESQDRERGHRQAEPWRLGTAGARGVIDGLDAEW